MNKGEIRYVDMPASNGHDQSGSRPVMVFSEADADIVIIIPFTSNLQSLRFPSRSSPAT